MENGMTPEILDKLTKVCICKAIPRAKMKQVIRDGADTLEKVRAATGAGSGGCKGQRCTPKIEKLLEEYRNKEWE